MRPHILKTFIDGFCLVLSLPPGPLGKRICSISYEQSGGNTGTKMGIPSTRFVVLFLSKGSNASLILERKGPSLREQKIGRK